MSATPRAVSLNFDRLEFQLHTAERAAALVRCRDSLAAAAPDSLEAGDMLLLLTEAALEDGDLTSAARFLVPFSTTPCALPARVLSAFGRLALKQGAPAEALQSFEEALRLDPRLPQALAGRGETLRTLGRLEEAWLCCSQALLLSPQDGPALNLLMSLQGELHRAQEAVIILRGCLQRAPTAVEARVCLASMLIITGRIDEAAGELHKVSVLSPEHPVAVQLLGHIGRLRGPP